jgi:integrase
MLFARESIVNIEWKLNTLPKNDTRAFGDESVNSMKSTLAKSRRRRATEPQKSRLLQISFHAFRHRKATIEYVKTKDVLNVMKILGHKSIQSTLLYTHLVNFESDDYHSATVQSVEEAPETR